MQIMHYVYNYMGTSLGSSKVHAFMHCYDMHYEHVDCNRETYYNTSSSSSLCLTMVIPLRGSTWSQNSPSSSSMAVLRTAKRWTLVLGGACRRHRWGECTYGL